MDIFAVLTRHSQIELGANLVHKSVELIDGVGLFLVDEVIGQLRLACGELRIILSGNLNNWLSCWFCSWRSLNNLSFLLGEE